MKRVVLGLALVFTLVLGGLFASSASAHGPSGYGHHHHSGYRCYPSPGYRYSGYGGYGYSGGYGGYIVPYGAGYAGGWQPYQGFYTARPRTQFGIYFGY